MGGDWSAPAIEGTPPLVFPGLRASAAVGGNTYFGQSAGLPSTSRTNLVQFGGIPSGSAELPNDLWGLTTNGSTSWKTFPIDPGGAGRPVGRFGHAMVSDGVNVVLFGGYDLNNERLADTWLWTYLAASPNCVAPTCPWGWMSLPTGPAPSLANLSMVYDSTRKRAVLVGIDESTGNEETWEFHPRGNSCLAGLKCWTPGCVDGVCCESIKCPACQRCDVPGSEGQCTPCLPPTCPSSCPAASDGGPPPDATCTPVCMSQACGDDGCGGACGQCPAGQSCVAPGQCVAVLPDAGSLGPDATALPPDGEAAPADGAGNGPDGSLARDGSPSEDTPDARAAEDRHGLVGCSCQSPGLAAGLPALLAFLVIALGKARSKR
jgi:hypothetical protein